MKTAGKTMKKQGTQPQTKKENANLIPRPNISCIGPVVCF
jgi:hypothetical protein